MKNVLKKIYRTAIAAGCTAAIVVAAAVPAMGNATVQILHVSDLEGGVDAIGDAPIFAAIMDP
ncbi:MAG: hypothetical protein KAR13_21350 [Desulfobulbaceae bacterium]|nr:hypothetical protein [Desulfobulbaceae bacterium]MCK5437341.1 hypothetical protein [Desulfobulbaceae bacterium]